MTRIRRPHLNRRFRLEDPSTWKSASKNGSGFLRAADGNWTSGSGKGETRTISPVRSVLERWGTRSRAQ